MINKLTLLLFLVSNIAIGQHNITGKVIDELEKPLPFVNVLLLKPTDSTLVKGTISTDNGEFSLFNIKNGTYNLTYSFIGFESVSQTISLNNNDLVLEAITLKEQSESLREVVVTAKKPLYEQKIDRLVVNVKNSITSAGGTALEVLERSPGVAVDRSSNTISMNGKDGLLVMINGKISRQPLSAIMQMLDGMNAENIEKIELITNPPAKYEAGGNAGIINIQLAKSADLGTNGSFSATFGYGDNDKEGLSLNLNHRKNKINVFTDLSFNRDHGGETFTNDREINNPGETLTFQTISDRDPVSTNFNGKLGLDYQVSDKTLIGAFVSGFNNKWDMEAVNIGFEKSSINPTTNFDSFNTELNRWSNISGNINIQQQLTSNSELNFDVDYLHYDNENPTSYLNTFRDEANTVTSIENIRATKDTPIDIWVARTDYTNTLNDKMKLEVGIKGITSKLDNNVDIQEEINGVFVRDEDLSEFSTLKEQIGATYASLSYTINDKTEMNIGLRYEHTSTKLSSQSEGEVLDLNYGDLFPTFFLSRALTDKSKLNFSYGRRITRPSYNDLAPFVIFLDPNTFFFGNTGLQPAISDNLKVDYSVNKTLLSIQYNHESDAIARYQPLVLETGQQVFTSLNLDYRNTYTLLLSQRFSFFKWWDGNINLLGIHSEENKQDNQEVKTNYININGAQTFKLTNNLTFEVSGWFQSERKGGFSTLSNIGNVSLGLQKKFSNDSKLRLTLNNVFGFEYDVFTTEDLDVNYFTNTNYSYEPRIVKLTYTYSFGNNKLKGKRNRSTGSEDIKSRVQ